MSKTKFKLLKEIKIKFDGSQHIFWNNLVYYSPNNVVVGKYVLNKEASKRYSMPENSYSWGVWPLGEKVFWGAYRNHLPNGDLINYRFDCLEQSDVLEVKDFKECVLQLTYFDLLLDAKVWRDTEEKTSVFFEDESEVNAAKENFLFTDTQNKKILQFSTDLKMNTKHILNSVDGFIENVVC